MVTIRRSIIPTTNRNYPNTLLNTGNLWITIHETGNTRAGANAKGEERFMHGGGGESRVAYHFAVDQNEAVQLLPLNIIGWHAGDGCDSRAQDVGCFASIAIETCVGDNNAHKAATRQNLLELVAAILRGDKAIDYRGTSHERFHVDRIAPHKRWSSYSKNCPRYMLEDGYFWTVPTRVAAILKVGEPQTPEETYAKASLIPELAAYASGDKEEIPAIVTLGDGTEAFFVGRTVEAIRETPRLSEAYEGAPVLNKPVAKGETFRVDWLFKADDGNYYYYTPWGTRIRLKDTRVVADSKATG